MAGGELGRRLLGRPGDLADLDRRQLSQQDPWHAGNLLGAADPGAALRQWQQQGALVEDGKPSYYLLEVVGAGGVPARFLLCGLTADERIHELEEGLERPARTPLEPVLAVAADDHQVLRKLLAEAAQQKPPDWETHSEGRQIRLWRMAASPLWSRMQEHLAEVQVRPLAPISTDAPCLAAILPLSDPGLSVLPVHRGLRNVDTFQPERFLTVVAGYARIYDLEVSLEVPQGLAAASERLASLANGYHAVLLALPGGRGKILRFRQGLDLSHLRAAPRNPTLRALDLALLNALVFRTVLGISEPEAVGHPHIFPVGSLDRLVAQVGQGVFQAGFALNPPPLWELRAVIEADQKLPPHTMVVEPAPPAGLLFMAP